MKDPAFLFYSSDFLTGSADLTMEERGQFITLMCLQHQHGHLPEKTIWLSLGLRSVTEIPDVMKKFCQDENGLYFNSRLDEEMEKRQKYTDSRRLNGNKGGRPKKSDISLEDTKEPYGSAHGLAYGKHMPNHSENENVNVNRNININKNRKESAERKPFKSPTIEEVRAYCEERKNSIDPQSFVDFYDANGWMRGKTKIVDWKACVRTWEQRETLPPTRPQRKERTPEGWFDLIDENGNLK